MRKFKVGDVVRVHDLRSKKYHDRVGKVIRVFNGVLPYIVSFEDPDEVMNFDWSVLHLHVDKSHIIHQILKEI